MGTRAPLRSVPKCGLASRSAEATLNAAGLVLASASTLSVQSLVEIEGSGVPSGNACPPVKTATTTGTNIAKRGKASSQVRLVRAPRPVVSHHAGTCTSNNSELCEALSDHIIKRPNGPASLIPVRPGTEMHRCCPASSTPKYGSVRPDG